MDVGERTNNLNEMIKETIEIEQREESDHDFFYYDNSHQEKSAMAKHLKRKVKPYTSSRKKTRNFLSNIAYTGVKDEDFYDNNFIFDTFTLLTKNLNPFSLERKVADVKNRDIIYMFWDECVEKTFYRHICERDNFLYLNGKNVLYPGLAEIVMDYINKTPVNIIRLRKCLQRNKNTVQLVYSRCYPEIYSLIDKKGIGIQGEFLLAFKSWKDKKKFQLQQQQQQQQDQQTSDVEVKEEDLKLEEKLLEKRGKRKVLVAKNEGLKVSKKKKKVFVDDLPYGVD